MKIHTKSSFGLAVLAGISFVTPAFAVVNIDYVFVGDVNNAADPANGSLYGAVSYAYRIAKNETTISQYAEFLNAVAQTDSHGLYTTGMTTSYLNGISQSGSSGSFTYSVNPGSGNKPITYVSWFDAARFCNWLQNGQQTGAGAALTTETGAYTLNGATSGTILKNMSATVWIPSENEWYKAAYYDPNKNGVGVGGYWSQATQSDTLAGNTVGAANSANYFDGDYVGSGTSTFPTVNALTDVGAYGLNSESAYGTNDQAGNVYEWNDTLLPFARVIRGGSWDAPSNGLPSSTRDGDSPTIDSISVGFRIATVPEPSAVLLTMLSASACLTRRRRSTL